LAEPPGCCDVEAYFLDCFGRYSVDGMSWAGVVPAGGAGGASISTVDLWMASINGYFWVSRAPSWSALPRISNAGDVLDPWTTYSGLGFNLPYFGRMPLNDWIFGIGETIGPGEFFRFVTPGGPVDLPIRGDFPTTAAISSVFVDYIGSDIILITATGVAPTFQGTLAGWVTGPYDGTSIVEFVSTPAGEALLDVAGTLAVGYTGGSGVGSEPIAYFSDLTLPVTFNPTLLPAPPGYVFGDFGNAYGTAQAVAYDGGSNWLVVGYARFNDLSGFINVLWHFDGASWTVVFTWPASGVVVAEPGVAYSPTLGRWMALPTYGPAVYSISPMGPWKPVSGAAGGTPTVRPLRAR
jgi:hypothetical protein